MWYFKGRRKKYKSPYTGKEVDAAVANSQAFPEYGAADSGKFLRVNADGKIDFSEYPIETKVETIFDGNVTTVESPDTVNVIEYSGTTDEFSKLTVKVNDETLTYDSTYQSFDDANDTVSILCADGYIKLFAYNADTFAVDIKDVSSSVDNGFASGVAEVASTLMTKNLHIVTIGSTSNYKTLTIVFDVDRETDVAIDTLADLTQRLYALGYDVNNVLKTFSYSSTHDSFSSSTAKTIQLFDYIGVYVKNDNDTLSIQLRRTGLQIQQLISDGSISISDLSIGDVNTIFNSIISHYIIPHN